MWHRSHINQLNRWFSEKITLRPKLIYMAGMKHVFPPETGNREGRGGEGGWPQLRVPRDSDLYPLPRICSVSWDPFQIKWLFRGSYPGELPSDASLHFEQLENRLVVGFYKSGTKEYWPGVCLGPFSLSRGRWDARPPWLGSKKFVGQ